jgi:hypothetical protein
MAHTRGLRVRYRTPLTAMLGAQHFIGGERGLAFTLNHSTGVTALWADPTPELDRVPNYPLGEAIPARFTCNPRTNDEHAPGRQHEKRLLSRNDYLAPLPIPTGENRRTCSTSSGARTRCLWILAATASVLR